MKKHLILTILSGITVAVSPALRAQDASPSPAASEHPKRQFHPGEHGGGDILERLKSLDLTEDQKTKIKPIIQDRREKMQAIHNDNSLTEDQKKEKAKEIFQSTNEQIKALLTPDQQKKFEQLMQEMKDHRKPEGNK